MVRLTRIKKSTNTSANSKKKKRHIKAIILKRNLLDILKRNFIKN